MTADRGRIVKTNAPRRKPTAAKSKGGKRKAKTPKRTPRTYKPESMTLEQWQIALRREFAADQSYKIENLGSEPFFSEFNVINPASGGEYRVAIRGLNPGENFCSCPDFAVNMLGTCKHTEAVLARLRKRRGGAAALRRGYTPEYSEVFLRYGARREVVFRAGTACPKALIQTASRYFDEHGVLRSEASAQFHEFLKESIWKAMRSAVMRMPLSMWPDGGMTNGGDR